MFCLLRNIEWMNEKHLLLLCWLFQQICSVTKYLTSFAMNYSNHCETLSTSNAIFLVSSGFCFINEPVNSIFDWTKTVTFWWTARKSNPKFSMQRTQQKKVFFCFVFIYCIYFSFIKHWIEKSFIKFNRLYCPKRFSV